MVCPGDADSSQPTADASQVQLSTRPVGNADRTPDGAAFNGSVNTETPAARPWRRIPPVGWSVVALHITLRLFYSVVIPKYRAPADGTAA
jgi:hypothetical protein